MSATLTKTEIIDQIAEQSGITKKDVTTVLNLEKEIIATFLHENRDAENEDGDVVGARVQIMGHGTYTSAPTDARDGYNPQSGKKIKLDASYRVGFRAGQNLKDTVKGVEKETKPAKSTKAKGETSSKKPAAAAKKKSKKK